MTRRAVLPLAIALLLVGCGGAAPPALRVGSLAFPAEKVSGLPEAALQPLADVAAWGLAVSEGRVDTLLTPLAARAAALSRLRTLSLVLGAAASGISDQELRASYAQAPEWELEVRHIVRLVDREAPLQERLEELERAEAVLRRASAGEDFARLAAEFSEEPGAAERGGRLRPGREGSWVAPFWEAAVALRPGELSPVVETEYGFHVLRLEDRRPVPFAEADRAALLRRVVPEEVAATAMREWATGAPAVRLDPLAVRSARERIAAGLPPDSLLLARGSAGAAYSDLDLAVAWAGAEADTRRSLLRGDDAAFASWLEDDVREVLWAADAERLGAPPETGAGAEELSRWRATAARWTSTFGFTAGMPHEALRSTAVRAVSAPGQEFRIARQELEALRPFLRALYSTDFPGEAAASSSSSEILNNESTG